ncbi:MAG: hypothetical protein ACYC6G_10505 [Desulfobaccales bacterium]
MSDNGAKQVPELVSVQEAAELLHVSQRWLYDHWREWGGTKIGERKLKFFKGVLVQRLEAAKQEAIQEAERQKANREARKNRVRVRHNRERKKSPSPARDDIGLCGAMTRWIEEPCRNKAIKGQRCAKHGGSSINGIT